MEVTLSILTSDTYRMKKLINNQDVMYNNTTILGVFGRKKETE